jgi:phage terminase large subunit-like protein
MRRGHRQASLPTTHRANDRADPDLEELLKITASSKTITTPKRILSKVLRPKRLQNTGKPKCSHLDELHAQPDRELWDVMTFGSGAARQEPLYWVITTAGDDPDRKSIGWEKHDYAKKIKEKTIVDPIWYVRIYAAPEDADIFDEQVWYDSNPSLAYYHIRKLARSRSSSNSQRTEKLFRYLRSNQWVSSIQPVGLPLSLWDSTAGT